MMKKISRVLAGCFLLVAVCSFLLGVGTVMLLSSCGGGKTILSETHEKNVNGWFEDKDKDEDGH